jgi:CDP-paratose 2-epimerase
VTPRFERATLITGGAGFVGTNVADRIMRAGRPVRILDDLSRPGVERNLAWLENEHGPLLQAELADLRDAGAVGRAVNGVDEVFHFAAQVAVTTSLDEPMHDAGVNLQGTLNLLEALRLQGRRVPLVFTSTNKVYGSLPDVELVEEERRYVPADARLAARGVDEDRPLQFCTPYGCSKGAADQYVIDYFHSYGLPTAVFRMSCIYGPHQFGTEDQGWVAHFLISAIDGEPLTIYGDGKQVRDILFVEDLVDAFLLCREHIDRAAGQAFNIGGGAANSISLLDLVEMISELRGEAPEVALSDWRQGDQRYYASDTGRFGALTGWQPRVDPVTGVGLLHEWLVAERACAPR